MLAAVEPGLGPGAIVLAHDGVGPGALREDCAETAALVGPLVAAARGRGLEPTALEPPLPAGNPDLRARESRHDRRRPGRAPEGTASPTLRSP